MHANVGDLLIYLGALNFFQANGNEIATSFCIFDAGPRAFDSLADCDVIVCHGGGNFGDIYPAHQNLREQIVGRFPDKPVVVMPQSFHFKTEDAMRQSASHFQRHPNLTIAVRDTHSESLAKAHFTDKVMPLPDMAHRLYDEFELLRTFRGSAPLYLMRRDVEASGTTGIAGGRDWKDLLTFADKAAIGRYRLAAMVAGRVNLSTPAIQRGHHRAVKRVIGELASRLVINDPWITSRLHGAIFGLLLGRTVTLHDNSYGKNSRYFAQWGKGIDTIHMNLDPTGAADHAA
ncbi:polysaccharide pyruvyl transferase family protein [Devosia pacifica]|nr:polysaccharide pyruvyl transferase family protein [Devosia pacifica]